MPRFLLSCVLVLFAKVCSAQMFADIPWGASVNEAKGALTAAGFSSSQDKDGDLKFQGTLIGFPTSGFVLFGAGKAVKSIVVLATPSRQAVDVYRDLRGTLTGKYGQPSNTYEFYSKPYYEGDGYQEQAIRLGKATFATFWGSTLSLEVTDRLAVQVTYEGPGWSTEGERRKASSRKAF